ncbi:hypothetical protein SAMN05428988_3675 [Chitinophaga sp. YR573]|uniref:hypothetical protein n=1 Tax=Chitinophaga sp. YR573 TaxID=1881040 RepID=UPI0008CD872F|nr:hypothetical protein [Chitinophaga sp. YR573]SEW25774.1 hypothetical protein SAMN05428988_3675 [Chitinophaga sp. YR573]
MSHDHALVRSNQTASRSVADNPSSKGISMPAVVPLQKMGETEPFAGQERYVPETPWHVAQLPVNNPVQRKVIPQGTELDEDILAALGEIDKLVQIAYLYLCNNPTIPQYVSLNGYTSYWLQLLKSEQIGYNASEEAEFSKSLLSAAAGYVIESIVTNDIGGTVNGYAVTAQVTKGNTRPDLILSKEGKEVAWVDITSSGDEGHVKRKAGNWKNKPSAEVTYISFTDEMLKKFLESDLTKIGLSEEVQSGELIPPHRSYANTHTDIEVRKRLNDEKSKRVKAFLTGLEDEMPPKRPESLRMKYVREAWKKEYNYEDISPKEILSVSATVSWHGKDYFNSKVKSASSQLGWNIINEAIEDEEIEIDRSSIKQEKFTESFKVFGSNLKESTTPQGKGKVKRLKEKTRQSTGGIPYDNKEVSIDDTAEAFADLNVNDDEEYEEEEEI